MNLSHEAAYRALKSHDRRFDGAFFVGVRTTGIYCRPICPANLPKPANVTFYGTAAEAAAAGFRPCLRCRPELAPGTASVDAVRQLAGKIAAQAAAGAVADGTVGDLAAELGISPRHLGRVFETEFGISPTAFAQTLRLVNATRLLTGTAMPIGEIAFESGYASVRRFNAAFHERYGRTPSTVRENEVANARDAIAIELPYTPPYDWAAMMAFLGRRAISGVEEICGLRYARSVTVNGCSGWIAAEPSPAGDAVRVTVQSALAPHLPAIVARVRHLFDLDAAPEKIAADLGAIAARNPSLRVPGAFDGFAMALSAVIGQQISVAGAQTICRRLAARFGRPIVTPFEGVSLSSPAAADIAAADAAEIQALGMPFARAATIHTLAKAVAGGDIVIEPGVNVDSTMDRLRALPGIGEWTAQYIAMRALAWPDAFPHSDLGILKALGTTGPKAALAAADAWRPWRAYAAMHLWHSLTDAAQE